MAYVLIIVFATSVHSIEFSSATTCFEQKERLEKVIKPISIACVKK